MPPASEGSPPSCRWPAEGDEILDGLRQRGSPRPEAPDEGGDDRQVTCGVDAAGGWMGAGDPLAGMTGPPPFGQVTERAPDGVGPGPAEGGPGVVPGGEAVGSKGVDEALAA